MFVPWQFLFASLVWKIWKRRNSVIFSELYITNATLLHISKTWCHHFVDANEVVTPLASVSTVTEHVQWLSGPIGSCTLNSDGAVNLHSSMGSISGLLRDHFGGWLVCFNKMVGLFSLLQAELWDIYIDLCLAWDNGYKHVQVQSDCSEALKLISSPLVESDACALVRAIA
ncbi:hypothetical protein V6N11_052244 [Hibiscus sabdariffa]|uniref:RNase H type-1 domain-containing protein n=1 Tax=Hibiscus sabdariffa TaxID=183260 RepID=A0ABR2U9P6_9ROSI